ncbi:Gfo/Idh/MocA family protein [Verrucomicrobiota bacterium]
MSQPKTAIIVGAGHRACAYASFAHTHPDRLKIVGVADPSALRRGMAANRFELSAAQCHTDADALAQQGRQADLIINGTMDHQHVPTSLPLLEQGYDMLIEKPFATTEAEMWQFVDSAKRNNCKVAVCHVLRHAPFYVAIREKIAEGVIGEVMSVQAIEHVSYHHMSVGYIRGKWRRADYCGSPMLMSKSCHDLDIIAWMKSGIHPCRVTSFGNNFQFRSEKAPPDAGTRCVVDCPIEQQCLYSARKHYLDHPSRWSFYVWDSLEHIEAPTIQDKEESLRTSPYGLCAWKTDMDVVDHQSVIIEFQDGCTATFNMIGGTSKPSRALHLVGTKGEIEGRMEDSSFVIRHIDPRPGQEECTEELVDLNVGGDMTGAGGGHGGGDMRMVDDFLKYVTDEEPSLSTTSIEDSVSGHLIGFCADQSMQERRVVEINSEQWHAHIG